MKTRVIGWKEKLLNHRKSRIRPGLDDKTLTSWSALVTKGLCDAAKSFGEERFYDIALKNGKFITEQLYTQNGGLWHTWKNGKASIVGFLEDYALTIQAFISLWEISGDEAWLQKARSLTSYTLKNFLEEEQNLFLFNEKNSNDIISNHFQIEDNVVAASNSVMAINLLKLSRLFSDTEYERIALRMARNIWSFWRFDGLRPGSE